jgi:hypothetical protein
MKEESDACPRCGSRRIVLGELSRGRTIGPSESFTFRAFGAQLSALRTGAKIDPEVAACSRCGLIWGEVKVRHLLQHLERFPGPDLAKWLKSANDTPI